jgi:hypothetical protein
MAIQTRTAPAGTIVHSDQIHDQDPSRSSLGSPVGPGPGPG